MNEQDAIAKCVALDPSDLGAILRTGFGVIGDGHAEAIWPVANSAIRKYPENAQIWQLFGLTARMLDETELAIDAFEKAARLAPADPLIAHSHARVTMEGGLVASHLFENARRLAPQNGDVILGKVAALASERRHDDAVSELRSVLEKNPLWMPGHNSFSKIVGQASGGEGYTESLENAIRHLTNEQVLYQALIDTNFSANDFAAAQENIGKAQTRFPEAKWTMEKAAFCASEQYDLSVADKIYDALGEPQDIVQATNRVRHHLRANRPEIALNIANAWIEEDHERLLWPYLSLAWRVLADPRWNWLEGDERSIGIYDLNLDRADLDRLADLLRTIHFADREPLDQSVRSGTQTDGPLFSRIEPEIRNLRALVMESVEKHIAQLPEFDPHHPQFVRAKRPLRFAGSWSVRLTQEGFHSDHVHSQGWLSSAIYIRLPEQSLGSGVGPEAHDGWLSLGENRELMPDLKPFRLIEPKIGRLVLFPSTMWHGTRPFKDGERLSVAFDIARPAQI